MSSDDLPATIATAKNVRGVAVYDPADPPDREVFTWLSRKHQYRDVGFGPTLHDAHPDIRLGDYKSFRRLRPPFQVLEDFCAALESPAPDWALESVMVASVFVTPLFVHRPALDAFENLTVWRLESDPELPEEQVLRHARIAGYGTLDFHGTVASRAREAIDESCLDAERTRRAEAANEDGMERFWRLLGEEADGDAWVGGYLDLLASIGPQARSIAVNEPSVATALGMIGYMAIDPPY
ncbi:MAG: hypothetical protein ABEH64_08690 [Salinirussus sp.]